jgi:hypothetical protein
LKQPQADWLLYRYEIESLAREQWVQQNSTATRVINILHFWNSDMRSGAAIEKKYFRQSLPVEKKTTNL